MSYAATLRAWIDHLELPDRLAAGLFQIVEILVVGVIAWLANILVQRFILGFVHRLARRTATDWDDVLVRRRVFHRLSHLAPAIILYALAPAALESPALVDWMRKAAQIYMLLAGYLVLDAALDSVNEIYQRFEVASRIPILGYLQVVKLVFSLAAVVVAVSILISKSPLLLLSGIGAATAIILLLFKDTILGLVAGIQLVAQDMLRPGDWIEMPKYGADGEVEQITLNVVKVRNWDKTVTTIPSYALISDSFKNWRGMSESGGRRIKRQILIDVESIRFCTPESLDKFRRIDRVRDYVEGRQAEIDAFNAERGAGPGSRVNGRRMTNVGVFREYVQAYLREHPQIFTEEMTFLVRQLQPSAQGLPIEIYVFSREQRWAQYEAIQADIFDHLFAALPQFELRAFQNPAGADFARAFGAAAPPSAESSQLAPEPDHASPNDV